MDRGRLDRGRRQELIQCLVHRVRLPLEIFIQVKRHALLLGQAGAARNDECNFFAVSMTSIASPRRDCF
jgi:hypothetical protein